MTLTKFQEARLLGEARSIDDDIIRDSFFKYVADILRPIRFVTDTEVIRAISVAREKIIGADSGYSPSRSDIPWRSRVSI